VGSAGKDMKMNGVPLHVHTLDYSLDMDRPCTGSRRRGVDSRRDGDICKLR